jgi:hypothetical protein
MYVCVSINLIIRTLITTKQPDRKLTTTDIEKLPENTPEDSGVGGGSQSTYSPTRRQTQIQGGRLHGHQ